MRGPPKELAARMALHIMLPPAPQAETRLFVQSCRGENDLRLSLGILLLPHRVEKNSLESGAANVLARGDKGLYHLGRHIVAIELVQLVKPERIA